MKLKRMGVGIYESRIGPYLFCARKRIRTYRVTAKMTRNSTYLVGNVRNLRFVRELCVKFFLRWRVNALHDIVQDRLGEEFAVYAEFRSIWVRVCIVEVAEAVDCGAFRDWLIDHGFESAWRVHIANSGLKAHIPWPAGWATIMADESASMSRSKR